MAALRNLLHELHGHFGELCVGTDMVAASIDEVLFNEDGKTANSGSDRIGLGSFCEASGRRNALLKGGRFRIRGQFLRKG
ncbi:unnamed protein product [Sphagnum jensenii]